MLREIIEKRRREKGLTLATLSSKSGVSIAHLGRIERGEHSPSGQVLRKLSKPLGFTEIELFKLAGFLSPDEVDDRMENLKVELKKEIARSLIQLFHKVDAFNAKVKEP